ncbi:MAG: DNA repair protein RadC [Verrucomicrobia bacterium]|nr:DNA repair protein RadC [Verrucomicrobiota bacterium]
MSEAAANGSADGNGGGAPARMSEAYVINSGAMRLRDLPTALRPREEMERVGVQNVGDVSLLAILLRSGAQGVNVVELATRILKKYGSLTGLASTSVAELIQDREIKGLGKVKAQTLLAALEIGRRLHLESMPRRQKIRSPADVVAVLGSQVRLLDHEVFWVLHLDAKNNLKGPPQAVSQGILDASLVHPREVFREAIRTATAAVVLAHNHPSGEPTPSADDIRITRQLIEAGRIIDIRVLDHIVIGKRVGGQGAEYVSMQEERLVPFTAH